jgi:hypothetical protein
MPVVEVEAATVFPFCAEEASERLPAASLPSTWYLWLEPGASPESR